MSVITAIVSADRRGIVHEWGDAHRPINVRSLRKSILTGLYGAKSVEKPNVNDTAQNPTVVGTFDAPRLRKHVPNALQVLFVEPEQMRHMEPPAAIES